MALSNNINNYADIAAVLKEVIPVSTARYTLDTEGHAQRWIMRAYKYRQLLQKNLAAANTVKGYVPPTPLDKMKLVREGKTVVIDLNPAPAGRLTLPDGKVIVPQADDAPALQPPSPNIPTNTPLFGGEPDDDLLEAARQLTKEHGVED